MDKKATFEEACAAYDRLHGKALGHLNVWRWAYDHADQFQQAVEKALEEMGWTFEEFRAEALRRMCGPFN